MEDDLDPATAPGSPIRSTSSAGGWSSASELIRSLAAGRENGSLSAMEWEHAVESLETRANATKTTLQDVLAGHMPEYAGTFACSQEVGAQLRRLREDVNEALRDAGSEDAMEGTGLASVRDRNRACAALKRLGSMVQTLEALQEIQKCLEKMDEKIEQNELRSAAEDVRKVEEGLEELVKQMDEFVESKVHRATRVNLRRKKAKLISAANELCRASLCIEHQKIVVASSVGDSSSMLNLALEALDIVGVLKSTLNTSSFAGDLFKHILLPVLVVGSNSEIKTHASDEINSLQVVTTQSSDSEREQDGWADGAGKSTNSLNKAELVLENILHIFQFIEKYVLESNTRWMGLIFNSVWGAVDLAQMKRETQERLLQRGNGKKDPSSIKVNLPDDLPRSLSEGLLRVLIESLPGDVSGLVLYQSIALTARALEQNLAEMGLFSTSSVILEPFLADTEGYLAQKRRAFLLHHARELILTDYFSSGLISSSTISENTAFSFLQNTLKSDHATSKGLFKLEELRVTQCARDIAELAISAMNEAVQAASSSSTASEGQLAFTMYQTCRDIFELFRLLIPKVYEKELNSQDSSRTAILFHNDCTFLAHNLVLLGYIYRAKFPMPLSNTVTTVDLVPPFRETAAKYLNLQVKLQLERVSSKCFGPSTLDQNETPTLPKELPVKSNPVLRIISTRTKSCLDAFAQMELEWRTVLSSTVFRDSIVMLGNGVLTSCVDFLTLQCGGHVDSFPPKDIHALQQILQSFKDAISKPIVDFCPDKVVKSAPGLLALTQVCALLEQLLTIDIYQDLVRGGALHALSQAQVKGLAELLFPSDSYTG